MAYALPARTELTDDLQQRVAGGLPVPAGLFRRTTGIRQRRVAADDEYASDLAIDATSGVRVNDATVVQADVPASNGVIHVIDTVLLPPTLALGQ